MPPKISELTTRWFAGARSAWPLFLATSLLTAAIGYHIAPRTLQPLPPSFAFANSSTTIEAIGTWNTSGKSFANATKIFCWFPVSTCQVTVAQLLPDGAHSRFRLTDQSFDIMQLSDAALTATASSTDPCHVQTLSIDRMMQRATLSIGPIQTSTCAGTPTQTATLSR